MALKKFIVCGDNHGDLVSGEATKKLIKFRDEWMPRGGHLIHVGDLFDMGSLRKGASDEERQRGISNDFQAGIRFLDIGFKFLTLGNHDARMWQAAETSSNGILREHCADLVQATEREFKKRKIQWVPYHVGRYLTLPEGGPKFLHGFVAGQYPATGMHSIYGDSIFGHVHSPSTFNAKRIDGGQAFSLGCMADIEAMTYAERHPGRLKWRNGFGFGLICEKTGRWNFWNVSKDPETGDWITPMGIL